jgi:hypothetical protein
MNGQIPFNFVRKIEGNWLINPLVMTFCVSLGSNFGHCAGNCSRRDLKLGSWPDLGARAVILRHRLRSTTQKVANPWKFLVDAIGLISR